jgi:protein gp37
MGQDTGIEWADATFNPWWGCTFVKGSPACAPAKGDPGAECYAKMLDARFKGNHWGPDAPRRFFGDKHWKEPERWNRQAAESGRRRRVFCMSMGDLFEGRPDERPHLERLWKLIPCTPWLDWMLLTKRPQLIAPLYPQEWLRNPPPNVWLGVTAETQYWLDIRWPFLRRIPAAIYFLTMEPLFERITLPDDFLALGKRAWVIVGGQSGGNWRAVPMKPDDARYVRDQCVEARVPFFFKQWGDNLELVQIGKEALGRLLDGREWNAFPQVGPEVVRGLADVQGMGAGAGVSSPRKKTQPDAGD